MPTTEGVVSILPRRGGLAAICCAALFIYAVYLGAISVLLPAIGTTFHLGSAAEGRLFPATFAGYVVGVLLCGALSDRLGRKAVLLFGTAAYALGLLLFGGASAFWVLFPASALIGGGSGAMETVASALASDLYPERRASIINALQIAFGAGATLSPILTYRLLAVGTDWRALYFGLAAANVALFVLMSAQRIPPVRESEWDWAALGRVLRQPAFGALCLAQTLYVGAETGFFSWMPTYFEKKLPGGASWAGWSVSVFWAAITLGRIGNSALVGRAPLMRLSLLMSAGAAVCSALTLVWTTPAVVMLWVALTGLCFSGLFGVILAEAGERYPHVAGTVFGGVVASGGVGGAIFPWAVGGLAATSWGWRGALAIVPVISLSIAALSLALGKERSGTNANRDAT